MIEKGSRVLISDLAQDERKTVEQWVKALQLMLRECECYLQDYVAGEQNVLQLLWEMRATREMLGEAMSSLTKKHRMEESPRGN
jgi:hypothetical protein